MCYICEYCILRVGIVNNLFDICPIPHFFKPQLTQTLQHLTSAYHPGHSTEVDFMKVIYDLFLPFGIGSISILTLLYFSSLFDTIDHYTCTPSPFGLDLMILT